MGEVELEAPYHLKTAQKKIKYGLTWKTLFWAPRQRLVDRKSWHDNTCQADKCTLYIYYIPILEDWDKSSYVFINDSTTTTSCSQYLSH